MKQPCLDCGNPTSGTRCPKCSGAHLRARNTKQTGLRKSKGGRPQYAGGWAAYSKAIRATATVCHLCGEGPKADDPWQADHIIPAARGGGAGPAAAAHRSCNVGRANRERHQQTDTPSPHGQGSSRR
jgi:5-methylcytosine-specific restriction endonuclease McrA